MHNELMKNEKSIFQSQPISKKARGITANDLSLALKQSNQFIDIDLSVLEEIYLHTEQISFNRRVGSLQCKDVMTREVDTLEFSTDLNAAWQIIKKRNMQALPVLSEQGRLLGMVTRSDFLKQIDAEDFFSFTEKLQKILKKSFSFTRNSAEVVGQIMRENSNPILDSCPVIQVIPMMLEHKVRHLAVVDGEGQFVGMINQTNLISALYQILLPTLNQSNSRSPQSESD